MREMLKISIVKYFPDDKIIREGKIEKHDSIAMPGIEAEQLNQ